MIYTEYWGLASPPFANDNRPDTFVPCRAAALAIARLRHALGTGMGASALYGDPGVGKSRVARMLAAEFVDARWLVAYLPGPSGTARDLLFQLDPAAAAAVPDCSNGLTELQGFIAAMTAHRKPMLVVVDDVQTVHGSDYLEMLRTLLNIEEDGLHALSILLVGQAAMERKLMQASRFDSQLTVRAVLEPMTDEETRLYILARLKAAGSRHGIFTRQAAESVVEYSRGNPRQVNRLCDLSLVIAFGLEVRKVTPDVVDMAAADLDLLPADKASFFPWPHPTPPDSSEDGTTPAEEDILAGLINDNE